jgi:hypothetical protein
MSQRKDKKERRRAAKQAEAVEASAKAVSVFRRRRITLIALAVGVSLLGVTVFNATREARLTLLNRTGFPLRAIVVGAEKGSKTFDRIELNDKLSVALDELDKPALPGASKGLLTLEFRRDGDDSTFKFRSWAGATDSKLHQVFTATLLPTGQIDIRPVTDGGTAGFSFQTLLRKLGLR